MIMNPLSPRPNYLFRKLDKKIYMCPYVWMCLHTFVCFVCILYVCVFVPKQSVAMLEKVAAFL